MAKIELSVDVRMSKDNDDGYQVFSSGKLIGRVQRIGTKWKASASPFAFETEKINYREVERRLWRPNDPSPWIDGSYQTRILARNALVSYLVRHKAAAVRSE